MRMSVDQSGQHDLASDVYDLLRTGRHDIGLNGHNLAATDGDVLDRIDARGGIDDAAPAQQQIERGAQRHCQPPGFVD